MVPASGVSLVEVDAPAVDETALGRSARCARPQRVHQHPGGHARSPSALLRPGRPDVDAERGADDVVVGDVRLEPEPARLLTVRCRRLTLRVHGVRCADNATERQMADHLLTNALFIGADDVVQRRRYCDDFVTICAYV